MRSKTIKRRGKSKSVTRARYERPPEWRAWRMSVYRRDGFTCVMCNASRKRGQPQCQPVCLDPHHIIRKIDRPDLMYVVDNGITLCRSCHIQVTGCESLYAARFQDYVRMRKLESAISGGFSSVELEAFSLGASSS